MGKVGKCSYVFHNTYLLSFSSVVGPKEKNGPLGNYFDFAYNSLKPNKDLSFEKTEIMMIQKAIDLVKSKVLGKDEDFQLIIGGDLTNQIASTSYALRDYNIPYIGAFAACSTITLNMFLAANIIENSSGKIICISSSHNATAERQFRYPNEYGSQRSNTFTTTVTGAGAIVLGSAKSKIKVSKATIGKVIDCKFKDMQDMGRAMAPAAFSTISHHLQDFGLRVDDYDLICTGDLSKFGSELLIELFKEDGIDIKPVHKDAGLLIYDSSKQMVFSGGSGSGCISVVLSSYIVQKMLMGFYRKVLICATGALMNTTMTGQKETIPAICHAISLEVE